MEEACLKKNMWNEYLNTYAYSFVNVGGEDLEMNDSLGSYRCGPLVKADFCLEEPLQYRDLDKLKQYKCNNLAFSTEVGGVSDAGPLQWMNTIGSIVVEYKTVLLSDCK